MATGLPVERSPSRESLRHVLELGENLLCIAQGASADGASASEILPAQCDLIAQTTSRLFNAQTGLWFSDLALTGLIGTPKLVLQAETDSQLLRHPTPLIQTCINTLRPAAAESAASVDIWDIKKSKEGKRHPGDFCSPRGPEQARSDEQPAGSDPVGKKSRTKLLKG